MEEIKRFEKADLDIMQSLIGLRINNIFKQLDFFILNFGNDILYTLHTYSFLRIRKGNEIIMTSTDEYLLPDHTQMPKKEYEKDEQHKKSLLELTLRKAKEMLSDTVISKVEVFDTADIIFTFDNDAVIEIFTDCQQQKNEFYRFFKYHDYNQPQYVILYLDNKIQLCKGIIGEDYAYKLMNSEKYKKLKEKLDNKVFITKA